MNTNNTKTNTLAKARLKMCHSNKTVRQAHTGHEPLPVDNISITLFGAKRERESKRMKDSTRFINIFGIEENWIPNREIGHSVCEHGTYV